MIDKSGLVLCPICHSKTKTKVNKDTKLYHFPLLCPKCGQESVIDVGDTEIENKDFVAHLRKIIHEEVTFSMQKEIGHVLQDFMNK